MYTWMIPETTSPPPTVFYNKNVIGRNETIRRALPPPMQKQHIRFKFNPDDSTQCGAPKLVSSSRKNHRPNVLDSQSDKCAQTHLDKQRCASTFNAENLTEDYDLPLLKKQINLGDTPIVLLPPTNCSNATMPASQCRAVNTRRSFDNKVHDRKFVTERDVTQPKPLLPRLVNTKRSKPQFKYIPTVNEEDDVPLCWNWSVQPTSCDTPDESTNLLPQKQNTNDSTLSSTASPTGHRAPSKPEFVTTGKASNENRYQQAATVENGVSPEHSLLHGRGNREHMASELRGISGCNQELKAPRRWQWPSRSNVDGKTDVSKRFTDVQCDNKLKGSTTVVQSSTSPAMSELLQTQFQNNVDRTLTQHPITQPQKRNGTVSQSTHEGSAAESLCADANTSMNTTTTNRLQPSTISHLRRLIDDRTPLLIQTALRQMSPAMTSSAHVLEACLMCDKVCEGNVKDTSEMTEHLSVHFRQELKDNDLVCSICSRIAYNQRRLTMHQMNEHATGDVVCDICDMIFTEVLSYRAHMRSHRRDSNQMKELKFRHCPDCSYVGQHLWKHRSDVHNVVHKNGFGFPKVERTCPLCQRKFNSLPSLDEHMKCLHTNDAPYECPQCPKRFNTFSAHHDHLRIHNAKAFSCTFCNRKFRDLRVYEIHMRQHSEEEPYKCSHCDKGFKQYTSFKCHVIVHHTQQFPLRCASCDKGFIFNKNLVRHLTKCTLL